MREHARGFRFMWPNPGEMEVITVGGGPSATAGAVSSASAVSGLTDTLYFRRVNRSDMPNPWAESIRSTARLPFRSRITIAGYDEELAGKSEMGPSGELVHRTPGWVDTLTAEGQNLDEYAAETFADALFEGVVFSFVDNDPRQFPDPASRRAAGAQPRVTKFRRCHVRRITLETRNGVPRLKQIVLDQPITTVDVADPDAWVDDATPACKVVTAGNPDAEKGSDERKVRTQLYVKNSKGEWVEDTTKRGFILPDNPLDELLDIPLVPHYTDRKGPYRGHCPFLDTAWTQNTIWNHNSELLNLAREATIAFVHQSGVGLDPVTKKPLLPDTRGTRFFVSTEAAATLTIAEMQGTALKSVMEVVEWKIALIEKAHHQIQVERPTGPVTAREITLQGVQASSALEMWVIFQEQAWKRILDLMALLGGLPKRGAVSIPHDFGLPNTGMERLHALFVADKMSPKNYWAEAKRAGDVDQQTFDVASELAWDAANRAALGGPGGADPAAAADNSALARTQSFIGT